MARYEFGDAGVAAIGEVGGLPGVRVGLGESRRVPITNIGDEVDSRKVGVEGGAFINGGRGGGSVFRLERGGAGGWEVCGWRGGAVLIRCDRSRTDKVMGARDAVISSLLGTVLATELTESWM